jgi:hypothetical protein
LEWNLAVLAGLVEPVQELDQWVQHKGKVDDKAQYTGVCEHFESNFNAVRAMQRDLEQVGRQ